MPGRPFRSPRSRTVVTSVIVALGAVLASACSSSPTTAAPGTTRAAGPAAGASSTTRPVPSTIFATDPATTVAATVGQTVALRVQTNPSTDDGWEVVRFDQDKLFDVGASYDEATSAVPGRPVTQNLLFRATAPGTATVVLRYGRPGAPSPSDASVTFTITIA